MCWLYRHQQNFSEMKNDHNLRTEHLHFLALQHFTTAKTTHFKNDVHPVIINRVG